MPGTCDCIHRFDCACNPPDPDPVPEDGDLYCANCFARIGDSCMDCAPGLVSKRERERREWSV